MVLRNSNKYYGLGDYIFDRKECIQKYNHLIKLIKKIIKTIKLKKEYNFL